MYISLQAGRNFPPARRIFLQCGMVSLMHFSIYNLQIIKCPCKELPVLPVFSRPANQLIICVQNGLISKIYLIFHPFFSFVHYMLSNYGLVLLEDFFVIGFYFRTPFLLIFKLILNWGNH